MINEHLRNKTEYILHCEPEKNVTLFSIITRVFLDI